MATRLGDTGPRSVAAPSCIEWCSAASRAPVCQGPFLGQIGKDGAPAAYRQRHQQTGLQKRQ